MSCLYKILGVAKTASKIEIKQAYRKLAVQFHPDKHIQSPPQTRAAAVEKFRQISNAYEILVDDRKRAAYDHKRQEHSNAGQSRQSNRSAGGDTKSSADSARSRQSNHGSYTKSYPDGGGEAKSPNAAQSRQSDHLKRQAAAALRHLRRVCVEFLRFTVEVIVKAVVRAVVETLIRLLLEMLILFIKALFQPSSKHEDEKKKK